MTKTSERQDGPTPNGGAYSIAYWQDVNGNPTDKAHAVAAEIVEYSKNDGAIARTYGRFQPDTRPDVGH